MSEKLNKIRRDNHDIEGKRKEHSKKSDKKDKSRSLEHI